jgi:nucleotide-binding universal stress UspA family protein
MFNRLIIATDLSKDSSALINCLGALKVYGAEKILLLQSRTAVEILGMDNTYKAAVIAGYEEFLQKQKKTLEKEGYDVETRILSGSSPNEINRIAADEDYSAVVAGAERHSSSDEVYFSDLANDLIHSAKKPVMLVRLTKLKEQLREGLSSYVEKIGCEIGNHVLFPTDFSENADVAFAYISGMIAASAKKVTLLHVQDKTRITPHLENRIDEFNVIDNTRLQNMKKILQEKGNAEVETVIKYGSPSVEILDFIREKGVNLVVMGSQGRGFVKEFFLGSVSHNIARSSPSSVLLIPTKR